MCRNPLDRAFDPTNPNAEPELDSLTVCMHCSAILQYDADLSLKEMTYAALSEIPDDVLTQIMHYKNTVQKLHNSRRT